MCKILNFSVRVVKTYSILTPTVSQLTHGCADGRTIGHGKNVRILYTATESAKWVNKEKAYSR